jgi:hypothetical protein
MQTFSKLKVCHVLRNSLKSNYINITLTIEIEIFNLIIYLHFAEMSDIANI